MLPGRQYFSMLLARRQSLQFYNAALEAAFRDAPLLPPYPPSPEKTGHQTLDAKIICTIDKCEKLFNVGDKKSEIKKHTHMTHTDQVYKLVLVEDSELPPINTSCLRCPDHCGEGNKKKRRRHKSKTVNVFSFEPAPPAQQEKHHEDISKIVKPMETENVEETVENGPTNYESEDEVDPCCKTETIYNPVIPKNDAFSLQFLCNKCGFRTKSSKTLLIVHKKSHKQAIKDNCKSYFKSF